MARKNANTSIASPDLRSRLDRAINEHRYQSALDLAKQLVRSDPTDDHLRLLVECYLGRGAQLFREGRIKDAQTVLDVGCQQARNHPALLLRFAEEFARCGDMTRALGIVEWLPEPRPTTRIPALAVDAALQRGAAGRELLPEALRTDFDRVRAAFDCSVRGEDDAAREALQGIALASPFLEWKLMLRGLLAYYAGDDSRAIENWARLDPHRAPWRLIAPQRAEIDAAFLNAQPPATQAMLRQRMERANADPLTNGLRAVQAAFIKARASLMPVFRAAEEVIPLLRQQRPDLLPRLARCLYWDIIDRGQPEDRNRYQRLFGPPADDVAFQKLTALVMEHDCNMPFANEAWAAYEKSLHTLPQLTDTERRRLRATILLRMGRNAEQHLLTGKGRLGSMRGQRTTLRPTAEECYRRAIAESPDWIEPRLNLIAMHLVAGDRRKTIAAAEELITHFPNHASTLENLVREYESDGRLPRAIELQERLLALDPLKEQHRIDLTRLRRRVGLKCLRENKFSEARAAFESALAVQVPAMQEVTLASMAITEFKAGNAARGEELASRARQHSQTGFALADGWMYALAAQLKLPKNVKARFELPFKTVLDATPPTIPNVHRLLKLLALLKAENISYLGLKSHEKKILSRVQETARLPYTEDMVEEIGFLLLRLDAWKPLKGLALHWMQTFPRSPYPLVFQAEVALSKPDRVKPWLVNTWLDTAKRMAEEMPRGSKRDRLLSIIEQLEIRAREFTSPLEGLLDMFGGKTSFGAFEEDDPW